MFFFFVSNRIVEVRGVVRVIFFFILFVLYIEVLVYSWVVGGVVSFGGWVISIIFFLFLRLIRSSFFLL